MSCKLTNVLTSRLVFVCMILSGLGNLPAGAQQTQQSSIKSSSAATPSQGEEEQSEEERRGMRRTYRQQRSKPKPIPSSRPKIIITPTARNNPAQQNKNGTKGGSEAKGSSASSTTSTQKSSGNTEESYIGVTVWQMRESTEGTERRKLTRRKGNKNVSLRPFRIRTDTLLEPGESYVFGVESTRPGYLYIVDQEEYDDGSLRAPSLIFPDAEPDTANNEVTAGRVVEIPTQKSGDYFEAERSSPKHVGEVLTIIVSEEPLIERAKIESGNYQDDLNAILKTYREQWGQKLKVRWTETAEEMGKIYTEKEGMAGADASTKLSDQDPLPQRLYQIKAWGDVPLIVTVPLRYRGNQ